MTNMEYCEKCSDIINNFANDCLNPYGNIQSCERASVKQFLVTALTSNGHCTSPDGMYYGTYKDKTIDTFLEMLGSYMIGLHYGDKPVTLLKKVTDCYKILTSLYQEYNNPKEEL